MDASKLIELFKSQSMQAVVREGYLIVELPKASNISDDSDESEGNESEDNESEDNEDELDEQVIGTIVSVEANESNATSSSSTSSGPENAPENRQLNHSEPVTARKRKAVHDGAVQEKRRRGAPRKVQPKVVQDYLSKSTKYKSMTTNQASSYRYYVNKKLTDKKCYAEMLKEGGMRSQYMSWKNGMSELQKKHKKALKEFSKSAANHKKGAKTRSLKEKFEKLDQKLNYRSKVIDVYEKKGARSAMHTREDLKRQMQSEIFQLSSTETNNSSPSQGHACVLPYALQEIRKAAEQLRREKNHLEEKKSLLSEKIQLHEKMMEKLSMKKSKKKRDDNETATDKDIQLKEAKKTIELLTSEKEELQRKICNSHKRCDDRTMLNNEIISRLKAQVANADDYICHIESASWNRRKVDLEKRTSYCHKQNDLHEELLQLWSEVRAHGK